MLKLLSCAALGLSLALLGVDAAAQARPTASGPGFALPTVGGTLRYSLSTSESLSKGLYNGSDIASSTNVTGNVAFITPGLVHPFTLIDSGGYLIASGGQPSTFFENLVVSQTLVVRRWSFTLNDIVNYLPVSPSTGLSGIPGVGDLNATPAPAPVGTTGPGSELGILSLYGPRLNNSTTLSASRLLTGSLSAEASGTYSTLRFLGGNSTAASGIDNSTTSGSAGLNYRIDARSRTGLTYFFTRNSFAGENFSFTTQGASAFYSRQMTRRLSAYVSGGPLKLGSSAVALSGPSVNYNASASVSYAGKDFTQSLSFVRSTSSGSGIIPGDIADSLSYGVNRTFGQRLGLAGNVGYARTHSLLSAQPFSSEGVSASAQLTQALARHVSAFASYTFQDQSIAYAAVLPNNAFRGVYQVASFGITYSPSVHRLGGQ